MAEHAGLTRLRRYVPLVVWVLATVTLLLIPLEIRAFGYIPKDDVHRHVAKAISGKPWAEILVMREDITIDSNAGWHAILKTFHQAFGWDRDTLVTFSVVGLFLLVTMTGLFCYRRPESWIASLLVLYVCWPGLIIRVTRGRPYLVSMAVLIVILHIWGRRYSEKRSTLLVVPTAALLAVAIWIHGSWYLFGFVTVALLVTGRFQNAMWFTVSWIAGTAIGSALTGHPVGFVWQQVRWLFESFGHHDVERMLVSEFRPTSGMPLVVLMVALVVLWKTMRGGSGRQIAGNPIFALMLLGWVFGLKAARAWFDWGLPAAIVWLSLELQEVLVKGHAQTSSKRVTGTLLVCIALFFATTSDWNSRWTRDLLDRYISSDEQDLEGWLPEDGGIVYSSDMADFYRTFYMNPHSNWRYVLGYEPTTMIEEDLDIYRNIQWNFGAVRAFSPWVQKMHPEDRLFMSGDERSRPNLPGLDWHYAGGGTWIGRLPRIGRERNE